MLKDKLKELKDIVSTPEFKQALVQQIVMSAAATAVTVLATYALKTVVVPALNQAFENFNSPETIETQI